MSYTNKTEFYEIPLPIETDLYDPMDYNESMEAVDTALHGAVQNASTAVDTANSASDAAAAATSGLEELSGIVNTEKGKLTALTARVTAAENEIDDVRSDDQDAICAFNEPTATSTHAYAIGDYFFYNNVLYKATAAIAISDTIVPNTNCEATNVTTEIDAINTALSWKKYTLNEAIGASKTITLPNNATAQEVIIVCGLSNTDAWNIEIHCINGGLMIFEQAWSDSSYHFRVDAVMTSNKTIDLESTGTGWTNINVKDIYYR